MRIVANVYGPQMRELFIAVLLVSVACKPKSDDLGTERAFVAKEVAKLEAAFATRAESGVLVGCTVTTNGLERMPPALAEKIKKLCFVDAPKLFLENAIADVKAKQANGPVELADLNCFQLLIRDAFELHAKSTPPDPAVQKLVDEYTALCPKEAAKQREAKAR